MSAAALVQQLRSRGFSLCAVDGSLRIQPGSALTPDDREVIRANLNPLMDALTPGEPWNQLEAIRLMIESDNLVERSGAKGCLPEIQVAAQIVCSAYASRAMETMRLAIAEFDLVVRKVAARSARDPRPSTLDTEVPKCDN